MSSNSDFRGDADVKTLADLNCITKEAVEIRHSDGKNMLRERKVSKDGNESSDENEGEIKHTNSKSKLSKFVKKYFLEGQKLDGDIQPLVDDNVPFWKKIVSSRRFWGIIIPLTFFQLCWWSLAIKHDFFRYFPEKYPMSITMIFGAMVAGMTSEGGGAVAFPVMTLALHISPAVARDFSLGIQSCGMSAAAFTIFWMKLKLEKHSLLFCSIGGTFGMIFGLEVIDPLLDPPTKKLAFVSIFFSFAFALFLLNRKHKRKTFDNIPNCSWWEPLLLIFTGIIGGTLSACTGSGVDICSFSILCILFRISEKVATPTSIVLMAINTCVGFFWRELMTDGGAEQDAWEYMAVCVPIVVFCAPMGSLIASHFHRQVLAAMIYILDTVALITALCVIPMFPNGNPNRIILVICLVIGGFAFFGTLSKLGDKYLEFTLNKVKRLSSTNNTVVGDLSSDDGNCLQNDRTNIAEDENLRKLSLGAKAARKV